MKMIAIDMNMPTSCMGCPCLDARDCRCNITQKRASLVKRPEYCPLREVEDDEEIKHAIRRPRSYTALYAYDKVSKRIFRIGDDTHDSLTVRNGEVHYINLQNGGGGTAKDVKYHGYVLLETDAGCLEDEFGIIDQRYKKEIRAYLDERRSKDEDSD